MGCDIALSNRVKSILNFYLDAYTGFRCKDEYGISAFQFWFYRIKNYLNELDQINHRLNPSKDVYQFKMQYWGIIEYKIVKYDKGKILYVTNIEIDTVNFYNWIYYHEYPSKSNLPKPLRYFTPKHQLKIFNLHIVKIYGKNKYNFLTSNNTLLLKTWIDQFMPIDLKKHCQPYGKYKIIGYCKIGGFKYALSIDGKLYDLHQVWLNENYTNMILMYEEALYNWLWGK